VEDEGQVANDRQRAEVFDALGHPTRIVILKALSEGPLGFADLKKKTAIDSSGHLQHHLTKLNGLIKTDEYGKYCLSDQGRDALLTVQTVENASGSRIKDTEKIRSHRFNSKMVLKSVSLLLVALLIASSAIALYEYNQTTVLQEEFNQLNGKDAAAYFNEFGVIPTTNVNSSFSPPISMYQALLIALENEGWNKTSLTGMAVGAYLMNGETETNTTSYFNTGVTGPVTNPPSNYSDVYGNGVIYMYIWEIIVNNATERINPPLGFSLIDASTGEILHNPPLY
jgi:DNA-binding HxlR family transcriptional regulator